MNFTLFISLINNLFVEIKWLKEFTRCRNIKKKKSKGYMRSKIIPDLLGNVFAKAKCLEVLSDPKFFLCVVYLL